VFFVYDNLVERRQSLILSKAEQSTAIVSSLFPTNVRDRLMQTTNETDTSGNQILIRSPRLTSLLGESAQGNKANSQPIADLFPNCTVLFADIAGFTAWSSAREPTQVFMLLESVYHAFDKVAARRRVFKVETIGDSCKFVQTHSVHPFPFFE
jgi:class 3 adenylate cyclase